MNLLYSTVNSLRDRYAPVARTSTFRQTGEITPDEFVAAGDYLVFKFPTWSWADAEPARRAPHLPPAKQFLVTRDVPCQRRLDDDFAGDAGREEAVVDGWLRTGGLQSSQALKAGAIRTVEEGGELGELDDDDTPDIPDMDDDEAIIREPGGQARTYTLYIMYSPYYRTPRLYLSGYASGQPLPPQRMMEDIVGDYKDKTVTLEEFPFFDGVRMASVHPCKHAPVMKTLLDRADAALRARRGAASGGLEGLQGSEGSKRGGVQLEGSEASDGWEEVQADEVAIRVDQYLVVFLKFIASVTPGIEHDFTMAV